MSAKEIALETLRLAADATPGKVVTFYPESKLPYYHLETAPGDVYSDTIANFYGNKAEANFAAHASPMNMKTLSEALLDALERIGSLEDGLDEIRSSEIEGDPLNHALWAIRLAGETLYPSEAREASDE